MYTCTHISIIYIYIYIYIYIFPIPYCLFGYSLFFPLLGTLQAALSQSLPTGGRGRCAQRSPGHFAGRTQEGINSYSPKDGINSKNNIIDI